MIILHKQSLRGNNGLKQRIWDGVKPIISEWVGHELKDTSLYGIRVYSDGAILATRK
jgi:prolyl 4-hydroxylase